MPWKLFSLRRPSLLQHALSPTTRVTRAYLQAAIFGAHTCREFRRFEKKAVIFRLRVVCTKLWGSNIVGQIEPGKWKYFKNSLTWKFARRDGSIYEKFSNSRTVRFVGLDKKLWRSLKTIDYYDGIARPIVGNDAQKKRMSFQPLYIKFV